MDTLKEEPFDVANISVYECFEDSENQLFSYTYNNELRRDNFCCFSDGIIGSTVKISDCDSSENQKWLHVKVLLKELK